MKIWRIVSVAARIDILIPLLLIASYLVLAFIAKGAIPTADELINTFSDLYARYGYEIIFVSALLESLVIVSFFVPGSFALALGVVFARTGVTDLTSVVLVSCTGALIGYTLDFLLGYFGFSDIFKKLGYQNLLLNAEQKLKRFGDKGIVLGFFHANLASIISVAAGATNFPILRFAVIGVLSTFFWATLWAVIIYSLGEVFINLLKQYSFLLFILVASFLIIANMPKRKTK